MTKPTITVFLFLFLTANAIGTGIVYYFTKSKIAYIDINVVYDAYKGKMDKEKELKQIEQRQQNILDSLKLRILDLQSKDKALNGKSEEVRNTLEGTYENYNRLKEEFSSYNVNESQKQMESLFNQINQYVKDYGKENGYDYILGAAGNGNLMYAKESKDISKPVLKYINERYEGR